MSRQLSSSHVANCIVRFQEIIKAGKLVRQQERHLHHEAEADSCGTDVLPHSPPNCRKDGVRDRIRTDRKLFKHVQHIQLVCLPLGEARMSGWSTAPVEAETPNMTSCRDGANYGHSEIFTNSKGRP